MAKFTGTIFLSFCFLLLLNNCKKDVIENRDFDPSISLESTVDINTSEIGGNGLSLISSRDNDSPLSNNAFNTIVSKEGEQLLVVLDVNKELRALTLSTPGTPNNIMQLDARSTAIALIFISPGILTIDGKEASKNISNIENLISFSSFQSYLKSNLSPKSVNDIVGDDLYDSLLSKCITEYYQKYNYSVLGTGKGTNEYKNLFSINKTSNNNLELENYGFRYVNVVQRDLTFLEEDHTNTLFSSMRGGVPFSWASLLTHTAYDPSIESVNYTAFQNYPITEFWVVGPGLNTSQVPPESIKNVGQPYLETVIYYIIFPFLDLWNGSQKLLDISSPKFQEFVFKTKAGKSLYFASTANSISGYEREVANYTITVFGAIAATSSLPIAAVATQILSWSSLIFSGSNLIIFARDMGEIDPYSKYIINRPDSLPELITNDINQYSSTGALVGGNISFDGGSTVIERGVYWGTSSNPITEGTKLQIGSGIGVFSSTLTDLLPNTKYYVKAYAVNNIGPAYGDQVEFTTQPDNSTIIFNRDLVYGTVSDVDGNSYKTIQIGTQTWMAENLRTTLYNDNTAIPPVTAMMTWQTFSTPAYCWYNNNEAANKATYGALYNWYVVDAASNGGKNACPTGWHVPSDTEWTILTDYLGGESVAGGKLKETGYTHWWEPNRDASNESGFTALPSSSRYSSGSFTLFHGDFCKWWTTTEYQTTYATCLQITFESGQCAPWNGIKNEGLSVRCLQD